VSRWLALDFHLAFWLWDFPLVNRLTARFPSRIVLRESLRGLPFMALLLDWIPFVAFLLDWIPFVALLLDWIPFVAFLHD
jgi:hypothetical protein